MLLQASREKRITALLKDTQPVVEMQRENTGSIWSEVFLHADVTCVKKHYAFDLKYDHAHVVVR